VVFSADLEERLRFVRAYLESSGTTPSSSKVEELVKEIERYTLASHLHWGLWGVISVCFLLMLHLVTLI
jgi:choline/ethanolamine kinase